MQNKGTLVCEHLSDAEAAEAVRRLDKGGTGLRPDRRGISAYVERDPEAGAWGNRVRVKDPRDVEDARNLLHEEGWPVVGRGV